MPKHGPKRSKFVFYNVLLTLLALVLLTACGAPTTVETPPAPTPTPTATTPPTPTPTPTPEVTTKTFEGDTFTIKYPEEWNVVEQGNQTIFVSPDQQATFIVTTQPNPNEATSPELMIQGGLAGLKTTAQNVKEEEVEPTKVVNGTTWHQGAMTGDVEDGGKTTNAKYVILITNSPANSADTLAYLVIYGAESNTFNEQETENFLPMLESMELGK